MAKVINTGYTDTAIAGNPTLELSRGKLNFDADFRVKSDSGSEVNLTNITCPTDRPEKIRQAYTEVANIYQGTGIEKSVHAPTTRGINLLSQLTEVVSVTDDTDPSYRIDLPMSAHLVIKVPSSEYITAAMVETLVARLLSCLYDTGVTTTTRLASLLRGSLKPADL